MSPPASPPASPPPPIRTIRLCSLGLCSLGLCSLGLCSLGLYSLGLCLLWLYLAMAALTMALLTKVRPERLQLLRRHLRVRKVRRPCGAGACHLRADGGGRCVAQRRHLQRLDLYDGRGGACGRGSGAAEYHGAGGRRVIALTLTLTPDPDPDPNPIPNPNPSPNPSPSPSPNQAGVAPGVVSLNAAILACARQAEGGGDKAAQAASLLGLAYWG